MIAIKNLKQPRGGSGTKLEPEKTINIDGVEIKNKTPNNIWVSKYLRKTKPKDKKL